MSFGCLRLFFVVHHSPRVIAYLVVYGRIPWITLDVVNHLFVVVCVCGPMINLPLVTCIVCQGVGVCGRVLWLLRITFDVVHHFFVGCGPHDKLKP